MILPFRIIWPMGKKWRYRRTNTSRAVTMTGLVIYSFSFFLFFFDYIDDLLYFCQTTSPNCVGGLCVRTQIVWVVMMRKIIPIFFLRYVSLFSFPRTWTCQMCAQKCLSNIQSNYIYQMTCIRTINKYIFI